MAFIERTTEYYPTDMHTNPYYNELEYNPYCYGDLFLPNCTTYCWGRWYEILESRPRLRTGNGNQWFERNRYEGIYECEEQTQSHLIEPRLGDILCFDGEDYGHVSIVEKLIYENGILTEIITSNSAWSETNPRYFYRRSLYRNNRWSHASNYPLQGVIRLPRRIPPYIPSRKLPLIYYLRRNL